MHNFNSKIDSVEFAVLNDAGEKEIRKSVMPTRQGTTYVPPTAFILLISNKDLSKAPISVGIVYGVENGKVGQKQRVFASYDELVKVILL